MAFILNQFFDLIRDVHVLFRVTITYIARLKKARGRRGSGGDGGRGGGGIVVVAEKDVGTCDPYFSFSTSRPFFFTVWRHEFYDLVGERRADGTKTVVPDFLFFGE